MDDVRLDIQGSFMVAYAMEIEITEHHTKCQSTLFQPNFTVGKKTLV